MLRTGRFRYLELEDGGDRGFHRIGEEALLMGLVMEFLQFFRGNGDALRPYRHGMEFDPAQDGFSIVTFFKISHRLVGIAFKGQVLQGGKGQKCKHVAA